MPKSKLTMFININNIGSKAHDDKKVHGYRLGI
jgi:hypothetical protein